MQRQQKQRFYTKKQMVIKAFGTEINCLIMTIYIKYSGGMAVYPANHRPFAVYSPEVEKTFFVLEVLILTI